ncbi:hypothetical protein ABZ517_05765 [Streptomyces scabiei]|uniref:hypothetical protein n=1 Tax=Streptomyces scabiei TaxID=1930 RepID=UPI0033E0E519
MRDTTAETQTEAAEDTGPLLTSYRVTWTLKGEEDKHHTVTCIVDSDYLTRPGDPEQLNAHLRKMICIRHLPIGQIPDNIVLVMVDPVCNCAPFPGEQCVYADYKGERFHLTTSEAFPLMEVVRDRHRDKTVGIVSISESVEFLTLVRGKYGHQ